MKFLRKRNEKERLILIDVITSVVAGKIDNLDVIKLKGKKDIFRVRINKFRIIFQKAKPKNIIIKINERDDRTYDI